MTNEKEGRTATSSSSSSSWCPGDDIDVDNKKKNDDIDATNTTNTTNATNATNANTTNATVLRATPLESDSKVSSMPHIPSISASAVLGESASMPEGTPQCRGYDFNRTLPCSEGGEEEEETIARGSGVPTSSVLDDLMGSYVTTGFQATNVGLAIDRIREMRRWRLSDVDAKDDPSLSLPCHASSDDDNPLRDPSVRRRIRARLFLAYTSNQISSGQREIIRFLVQHRMVDVVVATAGGVEEDLIKCLQPTYMGDFKLSGRELRRKGINRIGNLLVPNRNYCEFEDWIAPIIQSMHDEQDDRAARWAAEYAEWRERTPKHRNGTTATTTTKPTTTTSGMDDAEDPPPASSIAWTPSEMIERLGREIDDETSVLYWAAKNRIPVFCPALTDGSIGDMIYFHSYKRPGLSLDIVADIRRLNDLAVRSHATGMIILGGGIVKHHCCNANLMRNGADFAVYVNTANEFDGSDSGASPDEAISWGKIRSTAKPVKVTADATLVFPLIVSQTFAKNVRQWKEDTKDCVCHVDDLT